MSNNAKTTVRPQVLTHSGRYFHFLEPDPDSILMEDISYALSNICRFGGHTNPFYSVAQHSYLASLIVPPEDAFWGLLHDAAEAYTGDITTPLKQLLPEFQAIEKRCESAVFAKFGLTGPMPDSVRHADLVLLATEARDLLPAHRDRWTILAEIEPLGETIVPWTPATARKVFLSRFAELSQ